MPALWTHRPSDEEHEMLLKAMKEADYPSVSAFVREAVLRLIHADERGPVFTRLHEAIATAEKLVEDIVWLTPSTGEGQDGERKVAGSRG